MFWVDMFLNPVLELALKIRQYYYAGPVLGKMFFITIESYSNDGGLSNEHVDIK